MALSAAFNLYANANHDFGYNFMLLRQTQADSVSDFTQGGDQNRDKFTTSMSYGEREFLINQLFGSHVMDGAYTTEAMWNVSVSGATLDDPDRIEYSYQRGEGEDVDPSLFRSTFDRRFTEVEDDAFSFNVDFSTEIYNGDTFGAIAKYGYAVSARERNTVARRYGYDWSGASAFRFEDEATLSIEEIFPALIGSGEDQFVLANNTLASDAYKGTSDLSAFYIEGHLEWFDVLKISAGVRLEDARLEVDSEESTVGVSADKVLEQTDTLPSLNLTYMINMDSQLRAGYYAARNRPDFRELSSAVFYDSITGDEFEGDPDAVDIAEVNNFDLRYEYYWSDAESITVGVFYKDFINPIERTIKAKGGDAGSFFSFKSADTGYAQGLEVDFRKEFELEDATVFASGNLALIDTEVDLGNSDPGDTGTRQMQGQPEELANLQFGLDDWENERDYTLVMNYKGETLYSVGLEANGVKLPDVVQESRVQVDFNVKQVLTESIDIKASIKNLTDAKHELTQGGQVYRSYKPGIEYSLSGSWKF
jgi:hypothetical protein